MEMNHFSQNKTKRIIEREREYFFKNSFFFLFILKMTAERKKRERERERVRDGFLTTEPNFPTILSFLIKGIVQFLKNPIQEEREKLTIFVL